MASFSATDYLISPAKSHGINGMEQVSYASVAVTSAMATNDLLNFFYLPANARIIGATLKSSDIDTNGSPVVTIDVGDAGSTTRLFSASTVGQAGTVDVTMQAGGVFYKTTAKTLIYGTCHLQAATAAAGTVELAIRYVVEDSATSGS